MMVVHMPEPVTASRQKNLPKSADSTSRRGSRRVEAARAIDPLAGYERDFAELPNRRQPRRPDSDPPSPVAASPVPGAVDEEVPVLESASLNEPAGADFQSHSSHRRAGAAFSRTTVGVALVVGLGLGLAAASVIWVGGVGVPAKGLLVVSSHPSPAAVYVDGTSRGVTPMALELAAGDHDIDVRVSERNASAFRASIQRGQQFSRHVEFEGVAIVAGVGERPSLQSRAAPRVPRAEAPVDVDSTRGRVGDQTTRPIMKGGAGWVTFPRGPSLDVFEADQMLGSSAQERLALPEGPHTLVLVNDALGFRTEQTVVVRGGQEVALRIDWPFAALEIDTSAPARVTVDGLPLGETPLASLRLPIGPHIVILTHPTLGPRRIEVKVGLRGPNRLTVDFGSS
jgi:hypothetical protein